MNWLKYKKIYFAVSFLMIALSVFSLSFWGLKLGVDFTGGVILEYKTEGKIETEKTIQDISSLGVNVEAIQESETGYIFKLASVSAEDKVVIKNHLDEKLEKEVIELRAESVGPSIGSELVKKTVYAILIAAIGILFWVALQFKSFSYGGAAILAMLHDSFILLGIFSLLGHFWGIEIDFLFVTALLTTLSFSVHDTIVVFDRIREVASKKEASFDQIANKALTETMVRSLNNSFTIIFMLAALLLLGGSTVRWFSGALLVGTILGTYSSPFVAVPLLSFFIKIKKK